MDKLRPLVCLPTQAARLVELGIFPRAILWQILKGPADNLQWHISPLIKPEFGPEQVPAWTKAEIDALIGPRFAKADLWDDNRFREKSATDPHTYPVFFPSSCEVFENGAMASARGLAYLLENEYLDPEECNKRYRAVFK